jgi:predicted LPLAT superfamily acyltransferase
LQAFFGLLPFYTVAVAVRSWPLLYRSATAAAFAVVLAYTLASASLFVHPEQFRFGGNVFDGIVEMRQRLSDRRVLVFAPQEDLKTAIEDPGGIFNQAYHVAETVSVTRTIDPSVVDAACAAQVILCDYMQPENREDFERAASGRKLRKIDVYATVELQCFDCM